jgi:hypothetical protein
VLNPEFIGFLSEKTPVRMLVQVMLMMSVAMLHMRVVRVRLASKQ